MSANKKGHRQVRPATTPEGREQQLTAYAYNLAEKQLIEGTASSQTIQHFLKLGSTRERLEQERLRNENLYLSAKIEAAASSKRSEELYGKALRAMRQYTGQDVDDYDDEFYEGENL